MDNVMLIGRVSGLLGQGRASVVLDRSNIIVNLNDNAVKAGDKVMVTGTNDRYDYFKTISAGSAPSTVRV
ncbi:MAG: hypothetical protein HQK93_03395 [Nitrospirae bacterium]|nr:hypothetical protein [Nitrospirota bacterium]